MLTVDHGECLQVLVGLQLLSGTQRDAQSHGLDFPLNNVDVAGIQEENEPVETIGVPRTAHYDLDAGVIKTVRITSFSDDAHV